MTGWKQRVKEYFSERATAWVAYYADPEPRTVSAQHLVSRQLFALQMVEAAIPPSAKILDAGCGSGVTAARLMERGYAVWGIDLAEPMIRQARELCGSDQFGVGDIEHIPFADNTFDVVVSLGVIEYLESDEQALREILRVLRPGGRAVVAIPSGSSPLRRLDGVFLSVVTVLRSPYQLVKHRFRGTPASSPETRAGVLRRRFYRGRWLRLLRGLSFEPEDWICHGWGWFRSPLGLLVQLLSEGQTVWRRSTERLFGRAVLSRARDKFVRSRALRWLAAEHIFRARAIK